MRLEKEPILESKITHVGEYPIIPKIINGVKINFIGVEHTIEFLQKHNEKFKKIIHNSPLVIPETVPFDSKINKFFSFPDMTAFWNGIADIAKTSPKKITAVDPKTLSSCWAQDFLFNNYDFRNILSAHGIDQITKQYSKLQSPIAVIFGAEHPKDIISYLENENERYRKKQSYDKWPYRYLGKRSIRNYEFESNKWQLKSKIPL